MNWQQTFEEWCKPPSETEEDKASRAARMINDALRETNILAQRSFRVYPTGSYRNNTNIRLGSDVDIAVVLTDAFFYSIPQGRTAAEFGFTGGAAYGLAEFRDDVGRALHAKFGNDVSAGSKTYDIAGNTGRLPADVTPFLEHRRYTGRRHLNGSWEYMEGVETRPRDDYSKRLINWHDDHYSNGVKRNNATKRRFKRVTRILKRLRNHMLTGAAGAAAGTAASPAASFLIECLVYNAPEEAFNPDHGAYYDDVRAVLTHTFNRTKTDDTAASMLEVNEHKHLFGAHQGWTRQQANDFLLRAWQTVGYTS